MLLNVSSKKRAEKYLFLNLDILILKLQNFPAEIIFFTDLNLTLFSCEIMGRTVT